MDGVKGPRKRRLQIGLWAQMSPGDAWSHEGMVRLIGFIIEGIAEAGNATLHLVVPRESRDIVVEDLREIEAVEGTDWVVEAPPFEHAGGAIQGDPALDPLPEELEAGFEDTPYDRGMRGLADFANRSVQVDVWLSLHPHFRHFVRLKGRRFTMFPDAIGAQFPSMVVDEWGSSGGATQILNRVKFVLRHCDGAITFGRHVAESLRDLFGFPARKIYPIYVAPPDLWPLLSFLPTRRGNAETRQKAGEMLRGHAAERGWSFLADFPFEHVPYVAVSTQDRITKNLRIVADAALQIVRRDHADIKVITTATIDPRSRWTLLPEAISNHLMQYDVLSMPRLPREIHAAFYHCAAMVVNPSFFEGGRGSFPYFEAISVGTPSVLADSPNQNDLVDAVPEIADFIFNPYSADDLVRAIRRILANREQAIEIQSRAYLTLLRRNWSQVAGEYVEALSGNGKPLNAELLSWG